MVLSILLHFGINIFVLADIHYLQKTFSAYFNGYLRLNL
jgi:hypothetical protein